MSFSPCGRRACPGEGRRLAGRPTALDAHDGMIVSRAAARGVASLANARMLALPNAAAVRL